MAAPCWANPQSVSDLRSRSQSLEEQARQARQKKVEKLRQARVVEDNIVRNQMRLESSEQALNSQETRLVQTKNQLVYLTQRLDQTLGETTRLAEETARRLRQLYMGERLSLLQMILDAQDLSTLLDRLYYKQKLVAQDRQLLAALREKSIQLSHQKNEMAQQKQRIAATINKIGYYQDQIAEQIQSDRILRDRYRNDAAFYANAERQLLAESSRIRQQILALTRRPRRPGSVIVGNTGQFMWPVLGTLTSTFGFRYHPIHRVRLMHTGLDISKGHGAAVRAADGGEVLFVGWRGGYGKVVMINHGERHGRNLVSLYGHLSSWSVSPGQSVSKGQVVGAVGSTGFSTGPHLHFEIREDGSPVNPLSYLR